MQHRPTRPFAIAAASAALVLSSLAAGPVAASSSVSASGTADIDPEKVLSHFLCYRGKMRGFPADDRVKIGYSDFFSTGDAGVGIGLAFCNPVEKKKGPKVLAPISSPRQHLKFYDLLATDLGPDHPVGIRNQFGAFDIEILSVPTSLAVPTRKFPHKYPKGLDHFACHPVTKGGDVDLRFKLKDQFRRYKKMRVTNASTLCAPVDKSHDGRDFDARNPGAYLLCYDVSERKARPKRRRLTSNQFEKRKRIVAKRTIALCVPSSAVEVK